MPQDTSTLAELIGSRICHDLVSPIGAVTNGLELLELSGVPKTPELALVLDSVANANARIRFFRLAFGLASPGQVTGAEEVNTILSDLHADGRIRTSGLPPGSYPRSHIRLVLLAILCAEQAIPQGGEISVRQKAGTWHVSATGNRLAPDPELWAGLDGRAAPLDVRPATVQFAILPALASEENMNCCAQITDNMADITLSPA